LTANTVNGSRKGARSGAQTLGLLAAALNCLILRALSEGPKLQAELQRETNTPPQTTLRAQLKKLAETGAISKQRRNRFPGVLEYDLTTSGRELLLVVAVLERWLQDAPEGPLPLESTRAKTAVKALADGWSTTIVRALAAGPRALIELDRLITSQSYPALERRLSAMRLSGQVEARPGSGRGTPYGVTRWLREGVAPIAAAIRWERRHVAELTPSLGRIDIEAGFLLAAPLLQLPADVSGSCRMAAEIANGGQQRLAGVMVVVERGRVVSSTSRLQGHPNAWALGPPIAWLSAMIERDRDRVELGGDRQLAGTLLDGLHQALFAVSSSMPPASRAAQ
jgi:DNA-binding HxlR family transcriptional regulator